MKRNLIAMCCVAALACAGTASAAVLAEDSAANYTEETFVNEANLGEGFGAWQFWNAWPKLADSTAGLCGDINSENGVAFRFARDEGAEWCNGYRGFDALKPGDVLTFRFTCAYCGGGRGLDLFANGGHSDDDKIANVIHLSGDNEYSVNGTVIANNWAPQAVSEVTVSQLADGIQIDIKRTSISTNPVVEPLEYSTTITTNKPLTGIGLYAGGWNWDDGADVENYAFYVNDLKIEGEPPTDTLTLSGPRAVTSKEAELSFTLTRQNSEGELAVALASSAPAFASVPETVTIPDGETEVSFPVNATLQGNANIATLSASAEGVAGDTFEVRGPNYTVGAEFPSAFVGDTFDFWMDAKDAGVRDESKVAIVSEPEGAIVLPSELTWNEKEDGTAYVLDNLTVNASGSVVLYYDDVRFGDYGITVREPSLTLTGPTSVYPGDTGEYKLVGDLQGKEMVTPTLTGNATLVSVSEKDDEGTWEIPLENGQFELTPGTEYFLSVEFGDEPGPVTLEAKAVNGATASLSIAIDERPDFSAYIAYDDASLYGDAFDDDAYASLGEGTDKFQAWTNLYVNRDGETRFAGAAIVTSAGDASVLAGGKAFAVYANGDDGAEIQLLRPFVNPLDKGQEFSVLLAPYYRSGTKGVKFMGEWEGNWFMRAEFFYNDDGYFFKVDGDENATSLDWEYSTTPIAVSLKRAADGSSYDVSFVRGEESKSFEGITSFMGTVDGVLFYSYNGGQGDEQNFVFNKLAIEQVEEPIEPPPPAATMSWTAGVWNPDEVGVAYEFELTPSETGAIGLVDLALTGEGAELSTTQVDLSEGSATFTFTLTGDELPVGAEFTITATAQAEGVEAATYGITVWNPSHELVPVKEGTYEYDYVAGGTVEFWLYGTPSFVGKQAKLDSDNSNIIAPPDPPVATLVPYYSNPEDGKVAYAMVGKEESPDSVWIHARNPENEDEWGAVGITIHGKAAEEGIELPPFEVVKGRGLAWKASDLEGVALRGTLSLIGGEGGVVWTDLVEGQDWVIEGEGEDAKLIVLFDGPVFSGSNIGFVAPK